MKVYGLSGSVPLDYCFDTEIEANVHYIWDESRKRVYPATDVMMEVLKNPGCTFEDLMMEVSLPEEVLQMIVNVMDENGFVRKSDTTGGFYPTLRLGFYIKKVLDKSFDVLMWNYVGMDGAFESSRDDWEAKY